jgi:hypothetical protein
LKTLKKDASVLQGSCFLPPTVLSESLADHLDAISVAKWKKNNLIKVKTRPQTSSADTKRDCCYAPGLPQHAGFAVAQYHR